MVLLVLRGSVLGLGPARWGVLGTGTKEVLGGTVAHYHPSSVRRMAHGDGA